MSEMVDLRSCHISKIIFSLTMSTECKNEQYIKNAGKEQCCRWKLSSQVSPPGRTCSWPHCAYWSSFLTHLFSILISYNLCSYTRGGEVAVCGSWRCLGCPLVFLKGHWAFGVGFVFFQHWGRPRTPSQDSKQNGIKLEVRRELSKSSLIDVLANESHCNFSIEIIHQRSSD